MMQKFFQKIDPFVIFCFDVHDLASEYIAKNFLLIKRSILIVAYLSLFGVFFPDLRKGFGSLAEYMLLLILFLSPLSKIFQARLLLQMMGLRREFGILMGCLAIVHGVTYFLDPVTFSLNIEPYLNTRFFSMPPLFYFGILSLILVLPLLLTSNNFSLRFLGGEKWKALHRLVYVILFTALLHIFFVQSVGRGYNAVELIQPAGIIFGYVLLKVLAWKNFIAPLRDIIVSVGERYGKYVLAKRGEGIPSS
ncbi:MAG: ferric reductase-like transmembrane domain-containing protein [Candidatus Moranbacteria bacterium]|nr:ferric reductase-like transmembrane domain-containing protein [Candidatus Moranbacteria bacterium]